MKKQYQEENAYYFEWFKTGKIYGGNLKKICVPGMNCYSCQGHLECIRCGRCKNAYPVDAIS